MGTSSRPWCALTSLTLAVLLAGCATPLTHGNARTLRKGKLELSGGVLAAVTPVCLENRFCYSSDLGGPFPYGSGEVGGRYGVTGSVEAGLAVAALFPGQLTPTADLKVQLVRAPELEPEARTDSPRGASAGTNLAVGVSASLLGSALAVGVPLFVGFTWGDEGQFFVVPQLRLLIGDRAIDAAIRPALGVGLSVPCSAHWALRFEAAAELSIGSAPPAASVAASIGVVWNN